MLLGAIHDQRIEQIQTAVSKKYLVWVFQEWATVWVANPNCTHSNFTTKFSGDVKRVEEDNSSAPSEIDDDEHVKRERRSSRTCGKSGCFVANQWICCELALFWFLIDIVFDLQYWNVWSCRATEPCEWLFDAQIGPLRLSDCQTHHLYIIASKTLNRYLTPLFIFFLHQRLLRLIALWRY